MYSFLLICILTLYDSREIFESKSEAYSGYCYCFEEDFYHFEYLTEETKKRILKEGPL